MSNSTIIIEAGRAAHQYWRDLWRQALFRERDDFPWFVQPVGLALMIVVVGFYLFKSDNYGGFTNGLRWLMWLTPFWLTLSSVHSPKWIRRRSA